jgi:multisubunit Na+/H+ antiporter MnhB subunit
MLWVPALLIVALQYVGGIATPLWNAVFQPLETNVNYAAFADGLPTFWHAFAHPSLPLYLSLLAIALGVVLALSRWMRNEVRDVFDKLYPAMYHLCVVGGGRAFGTIQTGNLRHYLGFVLGAFLIGFAAVVMVNPEAMTADAMPAIRRWFEFWPGLAMGVIVCVTALTLPLTDVRVFRVLLLGACGFSVVGMYIIYQAPDLALTQLTFEFISVILFVLVLRLLPRHRMTTSPDRVRRAIVSILMGLAFGWITLLAATQEPARDRVGAFFAEYAHHPPEQAEAAMAEPRGGGGDNVVNVILVDFRGFDTLGEVTVLALAAVGVWSLMPGRRQRRPL